MGAAEARLTERLGGRLSRVPGGVAARITGVGATGMMLLIAGAGAAALLRGDRVLAPWVDVSLTLLVAAVAVAGMVIAARGVARRGEPEPGGDAADRPGQVGPPPAVLDRLQVETRGGTRLVETDAIEWIEAQGNYARLHLPDDALLHRVSLSRLEEVLDRKSFARVHRSAIVNVHAVARMQPRPSGDAQLEMRSGASVRLSRRYARRFRDARDADTSARSG